MIAVRPATAISTGSSPGPSAGAVDRVPDLAGQHERIERIGRAGYATRQHDLVGVQNQDGGMAIGVHGDGRGRSAGAAGDARAGEAAERPQERAGGS
ncbi:hypothetical protein [Limnoglobus roseus]|uniref:hypothetical protein n=1 Tax=Limnoglobus roseus TaxID=2598579 RepID=UPI0011EAA5FE|nr:hypothetical protein [Limnoglobus roseus]